MLSACDLCASQVRLNTLPRMSNVSRFFYVEHWLLNKWECLFFHSGKTRSKSRSLLDEEAGTLWVHSLSWEARASARGRKREQSWSFGASVLRPTCFVLRLGFFGSEVKPVLNTELAHHTQFSAQCGFLASRWVSRFFYFLSCSTCAASVIIISPETALAYGPDQRKAVICVAAFPECVEMWKIPRLL